MPFLTRLLTPPLLLFFSIAALAADQPGNDRPAYGETVWRLVQLEGSAVEANARGQLPNLRFSAGNWRVSGSGGCNRITGSYEWDRNDNQLRITKMVATRMACVSGMGQEQRFLQALGKVARERFSSSHKPAPDQLELLDASGAVLMRFEAGSLVDADD